MPAPGDLGGWCEQCKKTVEPAEFKERRQPQEIGGDHYKQGLQVSPWELQRTMATSGSAFVDARRADAIKYTWRMKGDLTKLAEDLKKARHCIDEAIKELLKEKA